VGHPVNEKISRPAGLLRRLAAVCYDLLLLTAVLALYTAVVLALRGGRAVEPQTIWFTVSLLIVAQLYFGWFWTHGGQTLGMLAWRIRLVTTAGGRASWKHAVLRYLAGWLSLLPLGLGFWWALVDARRRTWHDMLSQTMLVYRPKSANDAA
jgi:uncharacterized RDD family membrane protein YckC